MVVLQEAPAARGDHWIDGERAAGGARSGPVFDPARGTALREVSYADAATVARAMESSSEAYLSWSKTPLPQRCGLMFRFREELLRRRDDLCEVISQEHGKTLDDAAGEVQRGLEVVEFACGLSQVLKGELSVSVARGVDTSSVREPLGVVAGITPFNFPAMVPLWMLPIALTCGNTFVLKPSEKDPGASLLLAEMLRDVGLPDGAFNVVQGDRETVEALVAHPLLRAVSFVGSTPVARAVHAAATSSNVRVQALGGAKNHMVVLPDADLDLAADAAVSAAYGSAGERCMAISVVVAVGASADPLVERIEERIARLRVGAGNEAGVDMGPLITSDHRDRVRSSIEAGVREGAELRVDGRQDDVCERDGFFLGATLFDRVEPGTHLYDTEIFGPVLSVVRTERFDDAISMINASSFANGTAVFTHDGGAARRFQEEIEVGMVGINVPIPVPLSFYSFGGWRDSLFGDHSIYGPEGVRFYTRSKVITTRWPDPSQRGVDLGFPRLERE